MAIAIYDLFDDPGNELREYFNFGVIGALTYLSDELNFILKNGQLSSCIKYHNEYVRLPDPPRQLFPDAPRQLFNELRKLIGDETVPFATLNYPSAHGYMVLQVKTNHIVAVVYFVDQHDRRDIGLSLLYGPPANTDAKDILDEYIRRNESGGISLGT